MKKYLLTLGVITLAFSQSGCEAIILGGAAKVGAVVAEERTVGEAVDDTAIWSEIKSLYLQKNVNSIFSGINVEVKQGRVLLTGQVTNPADRVEAVRLAWQPTGVQEVINEIQITDKASISDAANDIWINTQVNTKLLVEKNVKSINYSVDTINGIVYLMGVAQNEWEMNQTALVASKVKGVKRVISHVQVKKDPAPVPAKKKPSSDNSN